MQVPIIFLTGHGSIFSIEVRQRRGEWREDLLQKPFSLKQQEFKWKDIR